MAKVGQIVTRENKEYTKNGTAIIPVEFAIKPGCNDISKGLVISDVANDVNVWNYIDYESAKTQGKKFINNNSVKSSLISGIQWDVTMAFVNGKTDGSGNPFYSSTYGSHRGRQDATKTGQNIADMVCNIYDLQGNYMEYVAERANCGIWPQNGEGVRRGGKASSGDCASSRWPTSGSGPDATFRIALYII